MLLPIGSIGSAKSTDTMDNLRKRIDHFLDYAATHPNTKIKYITSAIQLWVESDASYICESRAQSRAGGLLYLSDKPKSPLFPDSPPHTPPHTPNRHIQVISKIIYTVTSSAQEAENGAGFITGKEITPARVIIEEMCHPQGPTPLKFDNKCATRIINDEIRQKASKCTDIRFYWLRARRRQK